MLACVALCGSALAAPSATPNILPSESRGVSKAPPPQPINWDKVTQEATDLLSRYIQINTTNPPGNEIGAARMLKEKFLTDGIPATTWEPQHGRGIVAARLRGIGKHTKSIILLSHMDVVPANPAIRNRLSRLHKQYVLPPDAQRDVEQLHKHASHVAPHPLVEYGDEEATRWSGTERVPREPGRACAQTALAHWMNSAPRLLVTSASASPSLKNKDRRAWLATAYR